MTQSYIVCTCVRTGIHAHTRTHTHTPARAWAYVHTLHAHAHTCIHMPARCNLLSASVSECWRCTLYRPSMALAAHGDLDEEEDRLYAHQYVQCRDVYVALNSSQAKRITAEGMLLKSWFGGEYVPVNSCVPGAVDVDVRKHKTIPSCLVLFRLPETLYMNWLQMGRVTSSNGNDAGKRIHHDINLSLFDSRFKLCPVMYTRGPSFFQGNLPGDHVKRRRLEAPDMGQAFGSEPNELSTTCSSITSQPSNLQAWSNVRRQMVS